MKNQQLDKTFGTYTITPRGFPLVEFQDSYRHDCSLQISSAIPCENEDRTVDDPLGWLWLGLNDAKSCIMKSDAAKLGLTLPPGEESNGWMPYPIPEEVLIHTRMHLNEQQVRGLISRLQHWLATGELQEDSKSEAGKEQ